MWASLSVSGLAFTVSILSYAEARRASRRSFAVSYIQPLTEWAAEVLTEFHNVDETFRTAKDGLVYERLSDAVPRFQLLRDRGLLLFFYKDFKQIEGQNLGALSGSAIETLFRCISALIDQRECYLLSSHGEGELPELGKSADLIHQYQTEFIFRICELVGYQNRIRQMLLQKA